MRRSRSAPWVAALLLGLQALCVAYAADPSLLGHCQCTHGPVVDCDCPHHGGAAAVDPDANLPPCHRLRKQAAAAAQPGATAAPTMKGRCGFVRVDPSLLSWIRMPERAAVRPDPIVLACPRSEPAAGPEPFLSVLRRPPRARI